MSTLRVFLILIAVITLLGACASPPAAVPDVPEAPAAVAPEPEPQPPVEELPSAPETVMLFSGEIPAGRTPGRLIDLQLLSDGRARFQTDFLDGRLPLLETGVWQDLDGGFRLELTGTRRLIYDEPREVIFEPVVGGVIAVSYNSTIFGVRPMVLQEQSVRAQPMLAETSWQLVSLPQRGREVDDAQFYTLIFDESGALSGRADCNRFSGQFVDMDGRLALSALAMTRAACPDGSLGSDYAAAVSVATAYTVENDVLILLGESEEPIAVLSRLSQ